MRRIIAILSAAVLMVGMLAVSAAAVTKADLLAEAAKSPVYKYAKVSIENAARTVQITDEQADQIMPIVKRAVSILSVDHGPTYENPGHAYYSEADRKAIFECIDEICRILGWTYKMTPKANPVHAGDGIFQVFDKEGKLIFEYDGDAVADTDAAGSFNYGMLIGAVSLFVAGVAALVVSKRRIVVK